MKINKQKITRDLLLTLGFKDKDSDDKTEEGFYHYVIELKPNKKSKYNDNVYNVRILIYDLYSGEMYLKSIGTEDMVCIQDINTVDDLRMIFKFIVNKNN